MSVQRCMPALMWCTMDLACMHVIAASADGAWIILTLYVLQNSETLQHWLFTGADSYCLTKVNVAQIYLGLWVCTWFHSAISVLVNCDIKPLFYIFLKMHHQMMTHGLFVHTWSVYCVYCSCHKLCSVLGTINRIATKPTMYMTGSVPARFLVLVFHLILTIIVLMARVSTRWLVSW